MGTDTGIEWTGNTYNPWQGCTKVSPGCKFCYMYTDKNRYGQDPRTTVRSAPATFNAPTAKFGTTSTKGIPGDWKWVDGTMVFTCSWSDWFIEAADEWRDDAWDIIRQRPGLIFQILTKRPENVLDRLPSDWGGGWDNVWMGVSAEDQQRADLRIPLLEKIPAVVRFLSLEPLLSRITLPKSNFDWIIVGGESGPWARPMDPAWVREVRDYCDDEEVPFFFKQWGAYAPDGTRVGKKKAGCELEGLERKEFPRGVSLGA